MPPTPYPQIPPRACWSILACLTKSFLLRIVLKMFQIASLTALTEWDGHGKQCPIHCGNPDQALWEERVWEFLCWLCTSRRGLVGGETHFWALYPTWAILQVRDPQLQLLSTKQSKGNQR